jgi:hypothetical protein
MLKIPYGMSYFPAIRNENYVYVDKTSTIAQLEDTGSRYIFLLRPRRFGKSLLCSTLEHYYDVRYASDFTRWFQGTWIGSNPTPLKNTFRTLCLSFDGVKVDPQLAKTEVSFDAQVARAVEQNLDEACTQGLISSYDKKLLQQPAGDVVSDFVALFKKAGQKVYLIVDEYDNFVTNILVDHGEEHYKNITHGAGFYRSFWASIKLLTARGTLDRLFVTGVSPLVLADVTSGFNIGADYSTHPMFGQSMGFSESELQSLLEEQFKETTLNANDAVSVLREWYNGYCFSDEPSHSVYNSDMVLYFLREYQTRNAFPREMLDTNVRTDYSKMRHLLMLSRKLNGNFEILRSLLETHKTSGVFVRSFAFGEKITGDRFKSFLYFMGLTTFAGHEGESTVWKVPNLVIRTMMWEYIREALSDAYGQILDTHTLRNLFLDMAKEGRWKPVFSYLFDRFYAVASNRDFVFHELGIKMFLLAYLQLSQSWITHSEHELSQGFSDIYLKANPRWPDLKHSFIVELKYLPKGARKNPINLKKQVTEKVSDAEKQLEGYKPLGNGLTTKIVAVAGSRGLLYLEAASV